MSNDENISDGENDNGGPGPEKDDIMLMVWTGDQHHLGGGEENLLKIQQLELWVGNTTCHHHFKSSS